MLQISRNLKYSKDFTSLIKRQQYKHQLHMLNRKKIKHLQNRNQHHDRTIIHRSVNIQGQIK